MNFTPTAAVILMILLAGVGCKKSEQFVGVGNSQNPSPSGALDSSPSSPEPQIEFGDTSPDSQDPLQSPIVGTGLPTGPITSDLNPANNPIIGTGTQSCDTMSPSDPRYFTLCGAIDIGGGITPTPTIPTSIPLRNLHIDRICKPLDVAQKNITGIAMQFYQPSTGSRVSYTSPASPRQILDSILSSEKKLPSNAFNGLPDGKYSVMFCNTGAGFCGDPIAPISQIVQWDLNVRNISPLKNEPITLSKLYGNIQGNDPRIGGIPVLYVKDGNPIVPAKAGKTKNGIQKTITEIGIIHDPGRAALIGGNCVHSPLAAHFGEKELTAGPAETGVEFDVNGNGVKSKIAWLNQKDSGLLVYDRDGNKKIEGINELFGRNTKLKNNNLAKHGFEALSELNSNNDKMIDKNDPIYKELRFWFDQNFNGTTEDTELKTLEELKINRIMLEFIEDKKIDSHGNVFNETSLIEMQGGKFTPIIDVWFKEL